MYSISICTTLIMTHFIYHIIQLHCALNIILTVYMWNIMYNVLCGKNDPFLNFNNNDFGNFIFIFFIIEWHTLYFFTYIYVNYIVTMDLVPEIKYLVPCICHIL